MDAFYYGVGGSEVPAHYLSKMNVYFEHPHSSIKWKKLLPDLENSFRFEDDRLHKFLQKKHHLEVWYHSLAEYNSIKWSNSGRILPKLTPPACE